MLSSKWSLIYTIKTNWLLCLFFLQKTGFSWQMEQAGCVCGYGYAGGHWGYEWAAYHGSFLIDCSLSLSPLSPPSSLPLCNRETLPWEVWCPYPTNWGHHAGWSYSQIPHFYKAIEAILLLSWSDQHLSRFTFGGKTFSCIASWQHHSSRALTICLPILWCAWDHTPVMLTHWASGTKWSGYWGTPVSPCFHSTAFRSRQVQPRV